MYLRLFSFLILALALMAIFYGAFEKLLTPPADLRSLPTTPLETTNKPLPISPTQATQQAKEAFIYLNKIRQELNLNRLSLNPKLSAAAQNHANYSSEHNLQAHQEQADLPNFTGLTPTQRALQKAYLSPVSEVIAYNRNKPNAFVNDLMSAIYHRLSLLDMTHSEVGIGVAGDQKGVVKSVLSASLGNEYLRKACEAKTPLHSGQLYYKNYCQPGQPLSKKAVQQGKMRIAKQNPKLINWPKSGGTVPPVFYEESPDPLPNCNVSGYPVHLQVNPIYEGRIQFLPATFKLSRLHITDKIPVEVATVFTNHTDPNKPKHTTSQNNKKDRWIALFPLHRLDWNSRYQAEIQYRENGQVKTRRWNFFTPSQPNLHQIEQTQAKLSIYVGQPISLYFPPNQCNMPKEASFKTKLPNNLKLNTHFIDGQTLQLRLDKAHIGQHFSLHYVTTNTDVRFTVIKRPSPKNALK